MPTSDATETVGDDATRHGRELAILGAAIAVWRDMSVDQRQRIAEDAMVAMSGLAPPVAADAGNPGAAPECRR